LPKATGRCAQVVGISGRVGVLGPRSSSPRAHLARAFRPRGIVDSAYRALTRLARIRTSGDDAEASRGCSPGQAGSSTHRIRLCRGLPACRAGRARGGESGGDAGWVPRRDPAQQRPIRKGRGQESAIQRLPTAARPSRYRRSWPQRRSAPGRYSAPWHSAVVYATWDWRTTPRRRPASIWKLSEVYRHKSLDTLRGYVRRVDLFKEYAGAGFL
jgi:hypothetical protein